MSEDKVELLSTPYGEVAYETFRELGRAFVDKSSVIKDLEDSKTPLYPVLLRPRVSTTSHTKTDTMKSLTGRTSIRKIFRATTPTMLSILTFQGLTPKAIPPC